MVYKANYIDINNPLIVPPPCKSNVHQAWVSWIQLQPLEVSTVTTRYSFIIYQPFRQFCHGLICKKPSPFRGDHIRSTLQHLWSCFLVVNVTDAQNTLLSPSRDHSELLVNLKSSLIWFTLEQFPNFPDIFQRVASNYSPTGKAILDDTHSHVIWKITP